MEQALELMGSLSPGVVVAILSGGLLLIMLLIYSADASARDRKKYASSSQPSVEQASASQAVPPAVFEPEEKTVADEPVDSVAAAPVDSVAAVPQDLDSVWADAIKSMQSLQQQLASEISSVAPKDTEPRRAEFPAALLTIFKSLQPVGQGSWSAQQTARAWAAEQGMTQIQVASSSLKTVEGYEMQFLLDDRYFLLSGVSRKGAQSGFLELNLYYEEPDPIATIRYVLPHHSSSTLIQLRQGAWLNSILACAQRVSAQASTPTSS